MHIAYGRDQASPTERGLIVLYGLALLTACAYNVPSIEEMCVVGWFGRQRGSRYQVATDG